MAQHPFKVHFVGRFACLTSPEEDVVRLVAPDMVKAGFDAHRMNLAIPGRFLVEGSGRGGQGVAMVAPGEHSNMAESWILFDLTDRDVEFARYVRSKVNVDGLQPPSSTTEGPKVPDLSDPLFGLPPGTAANPALVGDALTASAPVTCRITVRGGLLRPVPLRFTGEPEVHKLLPLSALSGANPPAATDVRLADALEWSATQDDEQGPNSPALGLQILIRKTGSSDVQVIECLPTDELVMGFSHVCTTPHVIRADKEFAAFYHLLNAQPPADPVVPVLQTSVVACSGTDCSSVVRIRFGP